MKERIITFTRNEKNVVWIMVAMLLMGAVGIGLRKLPCTLGFVLLEIAIRCILLIALWFVYGVYQLFKIEEEKIRNNNCFFLLMANPHFLWLPIAGVESAVYSAISVMLGKPTNIIILILFIPIAVFLAVLVTKYFEK